MDSEGNIVLDQSSLVVDRVEGDDDARLDNVQDPATQVTITSASCMFSFVFIISFYIYVFFSTAVISFYI